MSSWSLDDTATARRLAMSISSNQMEHQMFASAKRQAPHGDDIADARNADVLPVAAPEEEGRIPGAEVAGGILS